MPRTSKSPGSVTSIGVLVTLALWLATFLQGYGERGAQAVTLQQGDQRQQESIRRLWDAIERARAEVKADLRHEIATACRCCLIGSNS